jgi:hypothetical protein
MAVRNVGGAEFWVHSFPDPILVPLLYIDINDVSGVMSKGVIR